MASVKLRLNRDRTLKDGSFSLVFQIIHRRQKKLIYTPFKLSPKEFDTDKQRVIAVANPRRSPGEIRTINRTLAEQRSNIESHIEELNHHRPVYSVDDILSRYKIEHNPQSLLRYIDALILSKQKANNATAAYSSTRSSLARFLGQKEINISQLDHAFVRDYVQFLRTRGVCDNTICYYIRNLKAIFHQAVTDGHRKAEENPFRNLNIKPRKTEKRAINIEVIRAMAQLDLSRKPNLEIARDIFLFSFFSRGMSFVDIVFLNTPKETIGYNRKKTKQRLNVTITPQLAKLITKYENETGYVFPILEHLNPKPLYKQYRLALERTNRNLKTIGKKLGLETNLTTYVARHSWATGAKKSGAPVSMISDGLGHTSEKTTQIYLKELDQTILDKLNEQVTEL